MTAAVESRPKRVARGTGARSTTRPRPTPRQRTRPAARTSNRSDVSRSRSARTSTTRTAAGSKRSSVSPTKDRRRGAAAPKAVPQKTDRPRLVVHRRRWVSARVLGATFFCGFFATLFLSVYVQSLRTEADRSIDSLDQQIREAAEHYLELRAEVAEKETPALVMEQARQLGMIDPGPVAPLAVPEITKATEEAPDGIPGA